MRVLAVGNLYPPHDLAGGVEVVWRGLVDHLRANGHQVRVLTSDYRRVIAAPDETESPDVYRELEWYWRNHEWRQMKPLERFKMERRNAQRFDRHLHEFDPEVITWWGVGGMSLGLIERARRAGIPALLFAHDFWPSYGPHRDLWTRMWSSRPRAGALAERFTGLPTQLHLAEAGRWLFSSRTVEQVTIESGVRSTDSTILSPGIDERFLDAPREAHPPSWQWRLLCIGRVVEQKGVHIAIEALRHLPAEAKLRILGDGDQTYRRELGRLARHLDVSDRVHFDSSRPHAELLDVYRATDAVVFPVEWEEPWGLVPLEAMALGRPVVASGTGGSRDYLIDGRNSLLFTSGDARSLAETLKRLAESSALRGRLCRGGYETTAGHSASTFNERALDEMRALITAPRVPHRRR